MLRTAGALQDDLEEMSGQELYALIVTRVGEGRAEAVRLELERKGWASIPFKESFGQNVRFDVQRAA